MGFFKSIGKMVKGSFGSILSAGASLLGSHWQMEFEKDMQNQTWAREDNAVQRRVADLKAAGLSPVLAAGSAASSSMPIRSEAREDMASKAIQSFLLAKDIAQRNENIATTRVQRELIEKQKLNAALTGLKLNQDIIFKQKQNDYQGLINSYYRNHDLLPPGQKLSGLPLLAATGGQAILNSLRAGFKSGSDALSDIGLDKKANEARKEILENRAKELRKGRK